MDSKLPLFIFITFGLQSAFSITLQELSQKV